MPTVGKLTSLAVLPVLMIGCAIDVNKPQAFVGVYGEFADDWSAISRIVEKYGFDARRMQVAPPSDANSALIVHGLSDSAESAAKSMARDLELELETPIQVRSTAAGNHGYSALGNHSYSDDNIGVYVMADAFAESVVDSMRANHEIVSSNEYIAQCDQFAGSLTLLDDDLFNLSGTFFDQLGMEEPASVTGTYTRLPDRLELRLQEDTWQYTITKVESIYEPVARTLLRVISGEREGNGILDCNFLQDLAVISTN